MKIIINPGDRFGKLIAIKKIDPHITPNGGKHERWILSCDCGNETISIKYNLVSGDKTSCGCKNIYRLKNLKPSKKHGMSGSRTYLSWTSMMKRCYDKNNNRYKNYGGRGISVCGKWKFFSGFLEDMGARPTGKTIDRINNDGSYCRENCKWSTKIEQMNNRTDNVYIEVKGVKKTISEWSRETGIKVGTIWYRKKSGMTDEESISKINYVKNKRKFFKAKNQA